MYLSDFLHWPYKLREDSKLKYNEKKSRSFKKTNKLIRHTSLKISSEFRTQCCDCGTCVLIYLLWSIGPSLIWYVIRVGTLIIMYSHNINNKKIYFVQNMILETYPGNLWWKRYSLMCQYHQDSCYPDQVLDHRHHHLELRWGLGQILV